MESIETNTKHYVELMSRAVDKFMPKPSADTTYANLQPLGNAQH